MKKVDKVKEEVFLFFNDEAGSLSQAEYIDVCEDLAGDFQLMADAARADQEREDDEDDEAEDEANEEEE